MASAGPFTLFKECEFVAAVSGDEIAFSQASLKEFCRVSQDRIAGFVPQPVIDGFESVQVHEQHSKVKFRVVLAALHGTSDALEKLSAVRESRERIRHRFFPALFFSVCNPPNFRLGDADLTQEDQRETQQGRQHQHVVGFEQPRPVEQDGIPPDDQAAQQAEMENRRYVGGHGQQEHQGTGHPGSCVHSVQDCGSEEYSAIPKRQEADAGCGHEPGTGDCEKDQRNRGKREHEPPLCPCRGERLVMDYVEGQKHDMEEEDVDAWAAAPCDPKRAHAVDPSCPCISRLRGVHLKAIAVFLGRHS